ncbi:MAG: VOC family protein [Bacteroidia bacterium]|nr:VOC family protein [Bacteroidia bacterium]
MQFHHIGLVVPNIQNSLKDLKPFIPFREISLPSFVGSQKVNVCFLNMENGFVELIEPVNNESPVAGYASSGGGIHHICFEVEDIYAAVAQMQGKGAKVIVEPVLGFENRLIAFLFLNMKNTNFNLIELAEKSSREQN